jgi:hypothetical protein
MEFVKLDHCATWYFLAYPRATQYTENRFQDPSAIERQ